MPLDPKERLVAVTRRDQFYPVKIRVKGLEGSIAAMRSNCCDRVFICDSAEELPPFHDCYEVADVTVTDD